MVQLFHLRDRVTPGKSYLLLLDRITRPYSYIQSYRTHIRSKGFTKAQNGAHVSRVTVRAWFHNEAFQSEWETWPYKSSKKRKPVWIDQKMDQPAQSGLILSATEPMRSFLALACDDRRLSEELRDIASDLRSRNTVPYKLLRAIWTGSDPSTRPDLSGLFSGSDFVFTSPKPREKVYEKARIFIFESNFKFIFLAKIDLVRFCSDNPTIKESSFGMDSWNITW